MDINRIKKAANIVKYAIENNISITKSCVENGFGNTYVKNTKAQIINEKNKGLLTKNSYDLFFNVYNKYINQVEKNEQIKKGDIVGNKLSKEQKNNNLDINYTSNSSYPKGHIKTLEQLLDKCEVDREEWMVKDYIVNKWDVTSWKNYSPETIENFQVKARLEKNQKVIDRKEIVNIFKENINKYEPPVLDVGEDLSHIKSNNLIEICLFDAHFNKYVWSDETDDKYDAKIAEERYLGAIKTFIDRVRGFGYERILYPIGNDFFNSDTMGNMTTSGTPQDNDLLWHQAFRRGVKLIKDSLYILKKQGVPIDVLIVPGNHDFANSFYLGEYLDAWFRNDELINIDNSPNPRKYYPYGNTLLGFTHGSEEKRDSLPMLMANQSKLWAESKYREWHLGHFHRKKNFKYTILDKGLELEEEHGVLIRTLSSISGTDSWHNKKGFVGNIKAGDGFVWSLDKGLTAHININV